MDWKRLLGYISGSVNEELLSRIEYLVSKNRILRGQIKGRILLSDAERKTLAEIGKRLGKRALEEIASIVKPETILGWHRQLIAKKFDGSKNRTYLAPSRHLSDPSAKGSLKFRRGLAAPAPVKSFQNVTLRLIVKSLEMLPGFWCFSQWDGSSKSTVRGFRFKFASAWLCRVGGFYLLRSKEGCAVFAMMSQLVDPLQLSVDGLGQLKGIKATKLPL